jgi:hypothetical protein
MPWRVICSFKSGAFVGKHIRRQMTWFHTARLSGMEGVEQVSAGQPARNCSSLKMPRDGVDRLEGRSGCE